jgi:hypothetical protein
MHFSNENMKMASKQEKKAPATLHSSDLSLGI